MPMGIDEPWESRGVQEGQRSLAWTIEPESRCLV
jgi:hypothetical protein